MVIILGRRTKIQRLTQIVSQSFDSIRLIESPGKLKRPSAWLEPLLVLVTDSFPGGITPSLLDHIKKELNPDSLIFLANRISAEMEINLRSAGLTFLGSYQEFIFRADMIFRRACS